MSSLQVFLSFLGATFYLVGFVPYMYHVFHGRVVPHAFSWTVWAILSAINTYVLFASTGGDFSLVTPLTRTLMICFGAIVAWFFIKRIVLTLFDYMCLLFAVIVFAIAWRFGAVNAIIPTIIVDILVLAPTLKKIWINPDSEDAFAWLLVVFSQACTLLALGTYTFETTLFWFYVMCMNACVAFFIVRRRVFLHPWRERWRMLMKKIF